jgi:CDP-glucose 4,6-dehydratase
LCGYLVLTERLWDDPPAYGEAWNFGPRDSDARPVGWVASRIVELWGDGARWEQVVSDPRHEATSLKVDAAKACARLGWAPRLPLDVALEWTVEWYKAYAEGQPIRVMTEEQVARFTERLPASHFSMS